MPNPKPFVASRKWFNGLAARHNLSLRLATNKAQVLPETHVDDIKRFHLFIRKMIGNENISEPSKEGYAGKYKLSNIGNFDQTPLAFDFLGGKTVNEKGSKTVWLKSSDSGLDKRQCTVQLTIWADGNGLRTKPLVIFAGKGTKINRGPEVKLWDKRVKVMFQDNAWVDETITLRYFKECLGSWSEKRVLVFDALRSQRTPAVKAKLAEMKMLPVVVPSGCTR